MLKSLITALALGAFTMTGLAGLAQAQYGPNKRCAMTIEQAVAQVRKLMPPLRRRTVPATSPPPTETPVTSPSPAPGEESVP